MRKSLSFPIYTIETEQLFVISTCAVSAKAGILRAFRNTAESLTPSNPALTSIDNHNACIDHCRSGGAQNALFVLSTCGPDSAENENTKGGMEHG